MVLPRDNPVWTKVLLDKYLVGTETFRDNNSGQPETFSSELYLDIALDRAVVLCNQQFPPDRNFLRRWFVRTTTIADQRFFSNASLDRTQIFSWQEFGPNRSLPDRSLKWTSILSRQGFGTNSNLVQEKFFSDNSPARRNSVANRNLNRTVAST